MKNLKKVDLDGTLISYDRNELSNVVEVRIDGLYIKHFPTLRLARLNIEKNPRGIKAYYQAEDSQADAWVPASGGLETATLTRGGIMVLYCYNHAMGEHAYLSLAEDRILTSREAEAVL